MQQQQQQVVRQQAPMMPQQPQMMQQQPQMMQQQQPQLMQQQFPMQQGVMGGTYLSDGFELRCSKQFCKGAGAELPGEDGINVL
jgi:hypothetical protein